MNQYEKSIERHMLKNEREVLDKLKKTYAKGLKDVDAKIRVLDNQIRELIKLDPENETLIRSKIYQKNYQEMIRKQIANNMDFLKDENLKTVNEYLTKMYEDGYLGTIYDIQQQGIAVTVPINQELLIKSVTFDTDKIPLSKRLYDNVEDAKRRIINEVSRGISTGASYADIARNVQNSVGVSQRKANMIAQNEGQRVRLEAAADSAERSKDRGADLVKQWNSTLDNKTRPVHRELDSQVAELDEPFKCSLGEVQGPKQFGIAAQDINCRCNVVYRVRDMIEDEEQRFDNESKKLITASSYADWKKKFYNQIEDETILNGAKYAQQSRDTVRKVLNLLFNGAYNGSTGKVLNEPVTSDDPMYDNLLTGCKNYTSNGAHMEYRPVQNYDSIMSDEDIINALAGGDQTRGSCASLGLAYIGQKQGWNVLDFRDGASRSYFSSGLNLKKLSQAKGVKTLFADGKQSVTVGNRLLQQCEVGKEYYLCCGRHAAIVRKQADGTLQYLELQSATKSGWTNFDGNARYTLSHRFGANVPSHGDFMIDIDDSDFTTDEFKSLLGYINTAEDAQKKGIYGSIK